MAARKRRRTQKTNGKPAAWGYVSIFILAVVLTYPMQALGLFGVTLFSFIAYKIHRKKHYQKLAEKHGKNVTTIQLMELINRILKTEKFHLNRTQKDLRKRLLRRYEQFLQTQTRGYVYFVKESGSGMVKIGKALDPYDRIVNGFGVKIPYSLELIHLIHSENDRQTEHAFHRRFKNKRVHGEWFKLNETDIAWIRSGKYSNDIVRTLSGF